MAKGKRSTLGLRISNIPCAGDEPFQTKLTMLAELKDMPVGDLVRIAIDATFGSELNDENLTENFFEKRRAEVNQIIMDAQPA